MTTLGYSIAKQKHISLTAATVWAIFHRDIRVTLDDFASFLVLVLLQPIFFLLIFGKLLPAIGATENGFATFLFPGIVAFTVVSTAFQGITLSLSLDLGYAREIDDRLLAPISVSLVAMEKVLFGAVRGFVAGMLIFFLGFIILGSDVQINSSISALGASLGIIILTALAAASLGLMIGTLIKLEHLNMVFSVLFTVLIFTGCMYYPWQTLDQFKWFQIVTLFNPLTYAAEGMRYTMIGTYHGHPFPTLPIEWSLSGLLATWVVFLASGTYFFRKRVIA